MKSSENVTGSNVCVSERELQLMKALEEKKDVFAKKLIEEGVAVSFMLGKSSPLTIASMNGNLAMVRLLVEKGADLNKGSPLVAAAGQGHALIVSFLLEKGANPDIPSVDGFLPLQMAILYDQDSIAFKLLDQGASVNSVDHDFTPLIAAVSRKNLPLVEKLIQKGADINKVSGELGPPLCTAAMKGDESIVKRLLEEKSICIDGRGPQGETAVMCAAMEGNKKIVEMLIEAGASLNLLNDEGESALDYADLSFDQETYNFLKSKMPESLQPPLKQLPSMDGFIRSIFENAFLELRQKIQDDPKLEEAFAESPELLRQIQKQPPKRPPF